MIDPAFFTQKEEKLSQQEIGFIIKDNFDYFYKEILDLLSKTDFNICFIITDILDIEGNNMVLKKLQKFSHRVSLFHEDSLQKVSQKI